jgi:hypothetical protein
MLFLYILLFATTALAEPMIGCDPPPAEDDVVEYKIYKNGEEVATVPLDPSGQHGFVYDTQCPESGALFSVTAINSVGESLPTGNLYVIGSTIKADLDCDNDVDGQDLSIFTEHFGQ